jgi:enoyl-CoA hydratase/carnithine racemase
VEYTNIKLEKENRVATIRLNRPDALNALSPGLITELTAAVTDAGEDQSIKALVIRGEGRAFCAGADLTYFQTTFSDTSLLPPYLAQITDLLHRIETLPFPAIAVVHGFALAGGLELMMACDMTLVADDARLGDQHVNFGLMPGGGSTQRLPQRVGLQRAMELLTTGRWISGPEAVEWGLALRSVPADGLDDELEGILALLRTKSREGLGLIKATTLRGMGLSIEDGVALESHAFISYMTTSPHPAEGIKAFIEKRQPEF